MTENPLKLSKSVTKKFCINKKKKSSYDNETKKGNAKTTFANLSSYLNLQIRIDFKAGFFVKYYGCCQILKHWYKITV